MQMRGTKGRSLRQTENTLVRPDIRPALTGDSKSLPIMEMQRTKPQRSASFLPRIGIQLSSRGATALFISCVKVTRVVLQLCVVKECSRFRIFLYQCPSIIGEEMIDFPRCAKARGAFVLGPANNPYPPPSGIMRGFKSLIHLKLQAELTS